MANSHQAYRRAAKKYTTVLFYWLSFISAVCRKLKWRTLCVANPTVCSVHYSPVANSLVSSGYTHIVYDTLLWTRFRHVFLFQGVSRAPSSVMWGEGAHLMMHPVWVGHKSTRCTKCVWVCFLKVERANRKDVHISQRKTPVLFLHFAYLPICVHLHSTGRSWSFRRCSSHCLPSCLCSQEISHSDQNAKSEQRHFPRAAIASCCSRLVLISSNGSSTAHTSIPSASHIVSCD